MTELATHEAKTDLELQAAIDACANEPIHIPGSIQPHGCMIVIDDDLNIVKLSQNAGELLKKELVDLLYKPLSNHFSSDSLEQLASITSEGSLNPIRSLAIPFSTPEGEQQFDAIIHKSGSYRILELELVPESAEPLEKQDFYAELMSFSVKLQKVSNSETLYDFVVKEVQRVTGFARVKLYQFDEEWNGNVVAESKLPHMPSYLGLSFPHSDIPKQARKLYSKNYLRLISDVHYQPVRLIPNAQQNNGEPIDLSFSVLRSVSPVHLQYLSNMNVQASMSISIMQNGKLWGLIACHHDKPYQVPYPVRMLSELLGHSFSAFLSSLNQKNELNEQSKKEALVKELRTALSPGTTLIEAIKNRYRLILEAVDADGAIIHLDGKLFAFGMIPEMSFAKDLIRWLENHHDESIFASSSIGRDMGMAVQGQSLASGVLAVPVSTRMTDYVMWFREEQSMQVQWAGKPEKQITRDETGFHLTPRASFSRWKEQMRGYSKPWSEMDIKIGSNIGKMLLSKHSEDSLRQKTENLDSIINNSSAMIYMIDTHHNLLNLNEAAQKTFETDSSVIGKAIEEIFPDDFVTLTKQQHSEVVQQQKSLHYSHEFSVAGSKKYYISINFPLYDANHDIYAVCVISTDITEIKEKEQALQQTNKELERMAYIASHDLQEPLRMISSFTDIIHKKYEDNWDAKDEVYFGFVLDASKRMKNLISDLLYYSRISNEKLPVPLLDTQKECDSLFDYLDTLYTGQDLTIKLERQFPDLHMHPEHFNCVMQNLISNGIKYAKKDTTAEITIDIDSNSENWIISVKDNGIGIKDDFFDKIFLIFKRLHNHTEYEGTGIGLALVHRIVNSYGGEVWLESVFGEGSTFYFSLPKQEKVS